MRNTSVLLVVFLCLQLCIGFHSVHSASKTKQIVNMREQEAPNRSVGSAAVHRCRFKENTGCIPHSNPHINGRLTPLNRTALLELSIESHPSNVYNKSVSGEVHVCKTKADCPFGKLCVDGECRCPILYSGSYDCTVQTPLKQKWCGGLIATKGILKHLRGCGPKCNEQEQEFSHLWIKSSVAQEGPEYGKDLVDLADFSTCAIVGGAASRKRGRGIEIDHNHTAVIRCNDGPTKKHGKVVGKKTTIRIQNRDYAGWTELQGEFCLPYTLPDIHPKKSPITWGRFSKCRGILPTELALMYFKHYWDVFKPKGIKGLKRAGVQTSAGFSAILFALHVCGKVDIYGFKQGQGHYYRKPHANDKKRSSFHVRHQWNYERGCINLLAKGGIPGVSVKSY